MEAENSKHVPCPTLWTFFCKSIKKLPDIPEEEAYSLAVDFCEEQDREKKEEKKNAIQDSKFFYTLMIKTARNVCKYDLHSSDPNKLMDLFQSGCEGAIHSLERYNYKKKPGFEGLKFFIQYRGRFAMLAFAGKDNLIRIPKKQRAKIKELKQIMEYDHLSLYDAALKISDSEKAAKELMFYYAISQGPDSLDQTIEEYEMPLIELIEDTKQTYQEWERMKNESNELIETIYEKLNDKEKTILRMRIEGKRHGEICRCLGISEDDARKRFQRIKNKIRDMGFSFDGRFDEY